MAAAGRGAEVAGGAIGSFKAGARAAAGDGCGDRRRPGGSRTAALCEGCALVA